VGIVGMYQAVMDRAVRAPATAKLKGLQVTVKAMEDHYWCTWCWACCKRRQATNHRNMHWKEWGRLEDPERKEQVYNELTTKYGEVLHTFRPMYMCCCAVTTEEAALLCILFVRNQNVHKHAHASGRMHAHWPLCTYVAACPHSYE
jgi:hypothetical protein